MSPSLRLVGAALGCLLVAAETEAAGNLATKPTTLPTLVIDKNLGLSVKEYKLSTGSYYKWKIESKADDEIMVVAPDLFRNVWLDQVVINKIELHPMGGIYGIEFDDEGSADIWFVPIRPGDFSFSLKGHEARGAVGKFVVR